MKSFLHYIRLLAAVTLITAHNLLRLGGFQTVPLRLAFDAQDDDFEGTVLKGIETVQRGHKELVSDFGNLQRETKAAFEDLTMVKRHFNSLSEFEQKLKRVELAMKREHRMAYGDPIKRVQGDEDMRMRLNAAVRLACKDPHVQKVGAELAKSFTQRGLDSENTPGSTLITSALANEIYDTLATYGSWTSFSVQRVGTSLTKFPVTTARPVAKAVRKLSGRKLIDDVTLAGTSVDCEVVLWGVLLGVETELLQDSSFDVTTYVLEGFGEAMALKLDELCLTADGTDDETDSGNSGVFTTGTAAVAGSGNTTIQSTDLEDWVT